LDERDKQVDTCNLSMVPSGHATPHKLSSIEIIKRQRSCRRLLFGVPDKEELKEWLTRNTNQRVQEQRSKWNFDFEHGVPVKSSHSAQSSSSSTYEYEKLDEKEVSQNSNFVTNLIAGSAILQSSPGQIQNDPSKKI
jgi:hypothetical protein